MMKDKMKKTIIVLLVVISLFSGCLGEEKTTIKQTPVQTPVSIPITTPIVTQTPTIIDTMTPTAMPTLKELHSGVLYVHTDMEMPRYWSEDKYEIDYIGVEIRNQIDIPIAITAQVVNNGDILEEKSFTLERQGESYTFTNSRRYIVETANLTLRLMAPGYVQKEYPFSVTRQ